MAAQAGFGPRHGDDVAGASRDVAVAARAEVRLGRLVRLHPPDVDLVLAEGPVGEVIHRQASIRGEDSEALEGPEDERGAHDERGGDHDVVARSALLGTERVHAHATSMGVAGAARTSPPLTECLDGSAASGGGANSY